MRKIFLRLSYKALFPQLNINFFKDFSAAFYALFFKARGRGGVARLSFRRASEGGGAGLSIKISIVRRSKCFTLKNCGDIIRNRNMAASYRR